MGGLCGNSLWEVSVGGLCGNSLWELSVGALCGTSLWELSMGDLCRVLCTGWSKLLLVGRQNLKLIFFVTIM